MCSVVLRQGYGEGQSLFSRLVPSYRLPDNRIPLGLSIRELICRVCEQFAHWCHDTDLREPHSLVADSGVVFSTVEPLCFDSVFLSGRQYYVLPRHGLGPHGHPSITMTRPPWFTTIRPLLVISTLIRLVLVLYSDWHDSHSLVKYTDVDYLVFTDATSYTFTPGPLNNAQGPLGKWVNIGE